MHRPFPIILCAALLALLVLAPPASAKNIQAVRICGPDGCARVSKGELSIDLVAGGPQSEAPRHPERWYRVRVTMGGHGAPDESWWFVVLPRGGYTGFRDGPGGVYEWASMPASTAAAYKGLTADLRPFPARRLRLVQDRRSDPGAATSATPVDQDGGGPGVAIARVIGGAVLIAAVAVSLYRRRR